MTISAPPPNVRPAGATTTGTGLYLRARLACWSPLTALLDHRPTAGFGAEEDGEQVGADREVGRIVADEHGAPVLLRLLESGGSIAVRLVVDGIHLGVELDKQHAVAIVDERGASVLLDHFTGLLQQGQRDATAVVGIS